MEKLEYARQCYAELNVDVEAALDNLKKVPLSVHCWQGDDVGGFESPDAELDGGGIQVTGNYPGKAKTISELRMDLEKVYSILPGKHRLNLHAIYGDFNGKKVERNKIGPQHFQSWIEWAGEQKVKLDFNATLFSHPKAADGLTLSHPNKNIREFWIEHCKQARNIAAFFGKEQGSASIHNLWIPDGTKDYPVNRMGYRSNLKESLDDIFSAEYPQEHLRDAVESKLFGIGSEAFVVGSHEFYFGYALTRNKMVCLDMGHFHPTELVADKISSIFQFQNELLLHVSRPMRWDSDHIVLLNDDIIFLMQELVRSNKVSSTYIGLDFFDATVNRVGAWVIGSRTVLKALLSAFLEPTALLQKYEMEGNLFARLALLEQLKSMPMGIIWDHYCQTMSVPLDNEIIKVITEYETTVQSKRS